MSYNKSPFDRKRKDSPPERQVFITPAVDRQAMIESAKNKYIARKERTLIHFHKFTENCSDAAAEAYLVNNKDRCYVYPDRDINNAINSE